MSITKTDAIGMMGMGEYGGSRQRSKVLVGNNVVRYFVFTCKRHNEEYLNAGEMTINLIVISDRFVCKWKWNVLFEERRVLRNEVHKQRVHVFRTSSTAKQLHAF